jgi:type II secretory pathway pseudopilin PulG
MLNFLIKEKKGITLIEVLVYIALLALASVIIVSFVISLITTQNKISLEKDTWENAQFAIDRISRDIQKASTINEGESTFEVNPGELTLNTYINSGDINTTAVKYYISNDRLYTKEGDGAAEPLTGENVNVTNFYLKKYSPASVPPIVQVDISVEKSQGASGDLQASASASTSVSLRNY